MIEFLHEFGPVFGTGGPAVLLAAATIMFFSGHIVARSTMNKLLAAKDDSIRGKDAEKAALKLYYEGRITDINAAHAERGADLRHVADTNARALQVAVDNVQKLLRQNDELLDICRVTAPSLVANRIAAEANRAPE